MNAKKIKSVLSVLMSCTMLFSSIPVSGYAVYENSGITISDYNMPSEIEEGKYFVIKGKLTSEKTIKNICVKISRLNHHVEQEVIKEVNAKEYDLKDIDDFVYFDILAKGRYIYTVEASFEDGNYVNVMQSVFTVGNPSGSGISYENEAFPPELVEKGKSFIVKCDIVSVQDLDYVSSMIYEGDGNIEDKVVRSYLKENIKSDKFSLKDDGVFDLGTLDAGIYTYTLDAGDYDDYTVNVKKIKFEVRENTGIKVENKNLPSGEVALGRDFPVSYDIVSESGFTEVYSSITKEAGNNENPVIWENEKSFESEKKKYTVSEENNNSFNLNKLTEGNYKFTIGAKDVFGHDVIIEDFDFVVKKAPTYSKIEISNYDVPSGILKKGSFFNLKGDITSKYNIKSISSRICLRNGETVQEKKVSPNSTTYTIFPEIDYGMFFDKLDTGKYTYIIDAEDEKGYKINLIQSDFEINDVSGDSKIEILDYSVPSGTLKKGSFFNLKGNITSKYNVKSISSRICLQNGQTVQEKKVSPNSTTYTIFPEIDDGMFFDKLDTGKYTYIIDAEDEKGYKVTLVKSDFEVNDVSGDSKIEISDYSVPSGNLKKGSFFNLKGNITSKYNIKNISSRICLRNGETVQEKKVSPNSTTYTIFPEIDYGMFFDKLGTGKYTYIIDAEDEKGYKINLIKSDFEVGNIREIKGDANIDGKVDVADVVAVASYVGNSDANMLEPLGIENGDVHNSGNGLDANDALAIQQYIAKMIEFDN